MSMQLRSLSSLWELYQCFSAIIIHIYKKLCLTSNGSCERLETTCSQRYRLDNRT
jgi:hypothetical protein